MLIKYTYINIYVDPFSVQIFILLQTVFNYSLNYEEDLTLLDSASISSPNSP